ncbi:kinesin-domain-containing protein [Gymnopus androsaceus JB14]|uniref:Kinesin-like protein n=1 Tax=Gymnopus androsaceus JB14 TaxID=1447944 RepID=A0A6A4HYP3_9AGAR|nr:kinesin-domain-containing protein [Gymnopus androsaceus JB14]
MSTQPVQIVARIRPPLPNEQIDDAISVLPIPSSQRLAAARPFRLLPGYQYLRLGQRRILPPLLKGHTLTILAYGPTSSGKTFTMEGSPAEPGIIPRSVGLLFKLSEEGKDNGEITNFQVHMSYLELYKDDAFDLLVSQKTHEKLPIRTNAKGETFVVGLTRVPISSFSDWEKVFRTASQNRTTGATLLNRASSRSHAMLTVEIEVTAHTAETREITYSGKINLVDLAGSENNKHTGNSLANPTRLAESAAINKSLSTLGQVVHALNTGASRIPYRDSNLTRLLSASLGGKALGKTILLCNLAPGVKFRSDVLNTLNFASRTKNIETKTVVNEREKPLPVEHLKEKEIVDRQGLPARRVSMQNRRASSSLIPALGVGSRIPSYGTGASSRLSGFGFGAAVGAGSGTGTAKAGIDDEELNERINRAVEAEVRKRLEEHEKRRLEEEERLRKSQEHEQLPMERTSSSEPMLEAEVKMELDDAQANMFGDEGAEDIEIKIEEEEEETEAVEPMDVDQVLLGVRNDSEIKVKMEGLERKYKDHIAQLEAQLAQASTSIGTASANGSSSLSSSSSSMSSLHVDSHTPLTLDSGLSVAGSIGEASSVEAMSPVSKKKMGRTYVALARAYSEKNDLSTALTLYRHAAAFVPDNAKLKERIIDVEWAVKNGKSYVPTPKRQHHREEKPKSKSSKSSRSHSSRSSHPLNPTSSKEEGSSRGARENMENLPKLDSGVENTPLKSSKRKRSVSCEPIDSESDYVLVAAPGPGVGFGVDLGNIDEEAEAEATEADEFGAKILRRSPRKKTTGSLSMRSPSVVDKRKMLGMTLAGGQQIERDRLHGPMDSISSHRTPGTPMRGNANTRKTRKVSELVGYRDEVGEEGLDVKQKRARLG